MGLITCPDCGNQCSDMATGCPKCGRPRLGYQQKLREQESKSQPAAAKVEHGLFGGVVSVPCKTCGGKCEKKSLGSSGCAVALLGLIFLFAGLLFPPIALVGIIMIACSFFLSQRKVWKCVQCGATADRA